MNSTDLPKTAGLVFDPGAPPIFSTQLGSFVFRPRTLFLSHICDELLLYDCIFLRCDIQIIQAMYADISCEELEPLLKHNKIKFFMPISGEFYSTPKHENKNKLMEDTFKRSIYELLEVLGKHNPSSSKNIIGQIEKYTVERQAIDNSHSEKLTKLFMTSFHNSRSEIQEAPQWSRWHEVGFSSGIGRIIDCWSSGEFNIHFDYEMEHYLKNCTYISKTITDKLPKHQITLIEDLHKIRSLPSLKTAIIYDKFSTKEFVDLVLSNEVHDLQKWLRKNIQPGLDVRDFYNKSLNHLPSKSNWTKWLKFGSSTILTSALSFFVTGNPAIASILGIGVGCADTAFGDKLTETLFDPYHPRDYLGFFADNV